MPPSTQTPDRVTPESIAAAEQFVLACLHRQAPLSARQLLSECAASTGIDASALNLALSDLLDEGRLVFTDDWRLTLP
jgi:hypothetical protein